uniref:Uncharacterized protein n=1 Tax=Anguilla anguilla TaxID=7936 RepID=A0A0E9PRW5_ANGAN
MCVNRLFSRVN